MPSPRPPDQLAARLAELEDAFSVTRSFLLQQAEQGYWNNVAVSAESLLRYEAEIRALRWALGNG